MQNNSLETLLTRYASSKGDVTRITVEAEAVDYRWMKSLFGFSDQPSELFPEAKSMRDRRKAIQKMLNNQAVYDEDSGLLDVAANDTTYKAGWFISPTVGEIKDLALKLGMAGKYRLGIVTNTDVGAAHLAAQPYETFQAASQLNALEMARMDLTPHDGIEIYIGDNTQGPRVALACAPGTFVRNHYVTEKLGQQFNALDNLKISHLNGYLVWGNNPASMYRDLEHRLDELMIPCMVYTQVAGATSDNVGVKKHVLPKLVHQIYSSAVPVDTYRNTGNEEIQLAIAHKILYHQYVGAIGMAIILHHFDKRAKNTTLARPRVHLTLLGGSAFNNPLDLIIKAIAEAIGVYEKIEVDIYIHGYSPYQAQEVHEQLLIPIVPFGQDLAAGEAIEQVVTESPIVTPPVPLIKKTPSLILSSKTSPIKKSPVKTGTTEVLPRIKYDEDEYAASDQDVDNYLTAFEDDEGFKVYGLRDYQKVILAETIALGEEETLAYSVDDDIITLFRYQNPMGRQVLGFMREDERIEYFINPYTQANIKYTELPNASHPGEYKIILRNGLVAEDVDFIKEDTGSAEDYETSYEMKH